MCSIIQESKMFPVGRRECANMRHVLTRSSRKIWPRPQKGIAGPKLNSREQAIGLIHLMMMLSLVESRTGAVALVSRWRVDCAFAPSPQSGLAWFCFLFPLIEPDRRISRIRLSEKTHTEFPLGM